MYSSLYLYHTIGPSSEAGTYFILCVTLIQKRIVFSRLVRRELPRYDLMNQNQLDLLS